MTAEINDEVMKKAYAYLLKNKNGFVRDFLRRDDGDSSGQSERYYGSSITDGIRTYLLDTFSKIGYISFGVDADFSMRFHTTKDGYDHALIAYTILQTKEM